MYVYELTWCQNPLKNIHSHKMRCYQLPVGLWRDSSSLTKNIMGGPQIIMRSTMQVLHIKLTIYNSTDFVPFLTCGICTVISTINTFFTNEKRNNVNTAIWSYLNHPSNVCHLAKLNESVPSIPNFQTFWKLLMNSNSCFFVYHSKYHRIRFGFPVSAIWGVEYWHLPFFHVPSLSIHDRWAGW